MVSTRIETVVARRQPGLVYPTTAPFDPEYAYPEYPFESVSHGNGVYQLVRDTLRELGLDEPNFGAETWNPFRNLVHPGGTVLIKPCWVRHYHPTRKDVFSIITHPAVLRPLVDYAFKAVGPEGNIWIMDAPLYDTDFAGIARICQLEGFEREMRRRGVPLTIADLRSLTVSMDRGIVVGRTRRKTWSSEGIEFDLGGESELSELGPQLKHIFGSDYDRRVTTAFHQMGNGQQKHCYRISRRVLEADLVISVPKLKTHKKTGVTLNVKNMIGINTDKNYIPHFRIGSPGEGGDEYPDASGSTKRLRRVLVRQTREYVMGRSGHTGEKVAHAFMGLLLRLRSAAEHQDEMDVFYGSVQGDSYRSGNWWGNDTCWRSALDINKIVLYGTTEGQLSERRVRNYLSVIDGIVGGEGTGPLQPAPRNDGVVIAGFDPLTVDTVAATIMGLPPEAIRDQRRAWQMSRYKLTDAERVRVKSNVPQWNEWIQPGSDLGFRPHYAWQEYFDSMRAKALAAR